MHRILLLLSTALLLAACEGETTYQFAVRNASSTDVTVLTTQNAGIEQAQQAAPGETVQILFSQTTGGSETPIEPTLLLADILVTNALGDTLQRDPLQLDNWQVMVDRTRRTPTLVDQDYILEVTDADF